MKKKQIGKGMAMDKWMHFGGTIPQHFDDHVRKSIPNYERVMQKIGFISQFCIENDSSYLDIGSSTGRSVLEVVYNNRGKSMQCDVVAYEDNYTLLQSVGFSDITVMDKDMNFTLFMAIK